MGKIPLASYTDCLRSLAGSASWVDLNSQLSCDASHLPSLSLEALQNLISLSERNEHQSSTHPVRVGRHAAGIAHILGQSPLEVATVAFCGLLHDIGKSSWPEEFTRSITGTPQERMIIEAHAFEGYKILSIHPNLELAALGAYTHHERLDGSGYPRRLAGDDIPNIGQILAVADLYDAITTRPRQGIWRDQAQAFAELTREGFLNQAYVHALADSVGFKFPSRPISSSRRR